MGIFVNRYDKIVVWEDIDFGSLVFYIIVINFFVVVLEFFEEEGIEKVYLF